MKTSTDRNLNWYSVAFVICSIIAFAGVLWLASKIISDNLQTSRSMKIATLLYRINALETRIEEMESGYYYRRIATVIDGDVSKDAVHTITVTSKLNESIAADKNKLAEAKKILARLTGREMRGDVAMAREP